MGDVLNELREALQRVVGDDAVPDKVLTGYIVVAEWSGADGERWLTQTAGDVNDEGPPVWTVEGWLWHALQSARETAAEPGEDDEGEGD